MTEPTAKGRVTRSISFEKSHLARLKKKAKKVRRSVNWLVNDAVRRDLQSVSS